MMKSINFQTCSSTLTPNLTHQMSLHKPKMALFFPFNKKSSFHFLTHCSTKPGTDLGNTNSTNEGLITNELVSESSGCQEMATNMSSSSNQTVSPTLESSRGLVFDLGIKGSWDSAEIGSPVVKRFLSDDQERWYMWYHGRSSNSNHDDQTDSIGIAISSNGIHWERGEKPEGSSTGLGRVMGRGEDWWAFDTKSVRPSEVIIMSSSKLKASNAVYWLYYTGFTSEQIEAFDALDEKSFFGSLPGLAISQDGRYWAKIEGEDHSGALFGLGSVGEWDSLFISSPRVVFHDNKDIRMYYHSFDPNTKRFCIGMARSRDGIKWVKLGKINVGEDICGFDEMGMMNPCVVRDKKDGNGKYFMAYEGVGLGGGRCIGLAVSSDGLKEWRRLRDEPVLKPLIDGWDCKGVGCPCLVEMDGSEDEKWRLYYRGIGVGGKTGIGMALCDVALGEKDLRFRRWVGFHV